MKKTFAFQVAVTLAALAMMNVACSRGGKSNNDGRVGAVGPADKVETTAEILKRIFKPLEATYSTERDSISALLKAASAGKAMQDTSANGAIGTPTSTFKVSLAVDGAEQILDFQGESTSYTELKSGKAIRLTTTGDASKLGESVSILAQCVDNCDRVAVLVLAYKKEAYKMDSKVQTAGIIFHSREGKGYQVEHSLTPIENLAPRAPVVAEGPQTFETGIPL